MKFSVIIPLYNKARHIKGTVQSVLDQTERDFEVIVVDDGSTDESPAIIEKMASPKLHIFRKENGGSSTARNYGVQQSQGRYICLLDADDLYLPHFLENMAALIRTYPNCGLYGTNYVFQRGSRSLAPHHFGLKDQTLQVVPDYFESVVYGDQVLTASSCCFSRAVFDKTGGFDENVRTTEDQLFFNTVALHHEVAFHREVSAVYNQGAENMKTHRVPKHEIEFAAQLQQMIDAGKVPEKHLFNARKIVAANLIGVASMNILAGDKATARKFLKDSRTDLLPERKRYWEILLRFPAFLVRGLYEWRRKILNKR